MAGASTSGDDDDSRCLLLALSHDELGVIVDGLADPLQPVVAVALSGTCLGLRTPLRAVLEVLKERNERAVALCHKMETSCAQLRDAEELIWIGNNEKELTADDVATLGMLLQTNRLPQLVYCDLSGNGFEDSSMQTLIEGLGRGGAPSLRILALAHNIIGPVGAETLATALLRGVLPKLERLNLGHNPIGNKGVRALAKPLRSRMPALQDLFLGTCGIGDEGVASLVSNLGKDDFRQLNQLWLSGNKLADVGMGTLAEAFETGGLPKLSCDDWLVLGFFRHNPASAAAVQAARDALTKRLQ